MILKFQWLACVAMLLGATFTSTCNAGLIFSFATNGGSFSITPSGTDVTAGYRFNVSSTIDIDGLAFWDDGNNGIGAHTVTLWDANTQAVLRSAVVDGSSGVDTVVPGLGSWRVSSVSALSLTAGSYVIGAGIPSSNTDPIWTGTTVSAVTGASYVEARDGAGLNLFPTSNLGTSGSYFGPNLRIAAVPEPSSMALLGIAGLGFGWRKLRKKTAKAS
ncbi:MAG: PEP-CTERM sorting domain-containing protein [Pirellulales bacterium]